MNDVTAVDSVVPLPRMAPEEKGVPSSRILDFLDQIEAQGLGLHSFMILREGAVLAEGWWAPFRAETPHLLYSLSKSFTSTAVGFAVAEGKLVLDDLVVGFFPDDLPEAPSDHLRQMRVRHLLTMTAGHGAEDLSEFRTAPSGNWARAFLARSVPFAPGTHFLYNSGATYMLSAILARVTGESLVDYLRPRLLTPLGIHELTTETCPRGIAVGGWGMSVTTESIARFGQFYLQRGNWQGHQLLDAAWIDEATSACVPNGTDPQSDWAQGYGYQFWRSRAGAYRGDGAFGQFCIVLPEPQMVIAITASEARMQEILNAVWAHLIPSAWESTPEAPQMEELGVRTERLILRGPSGSPTSPNVRRLSGRHYSSTEFRGGRTVFAWYFGERRAELSYSAADFNGSLHVGSEGWIRQTLPGDDFLGAPLSGEFAARGAWVSDDTFEVKLCHLTSPTEGILRTRFDEAGAALETTYRHTFGPSEGPKWFGVTPSRS